MSPAAAVFELPPIAEPAVIIEITQSVFDFAEKVSLEPAVKLISPDDVVVTTNCCLNVTVVCGAPEFASVFNVLITFFLNFLRRTFFCWSRRVFLNLTNCTDVTAVAEFKFDEPLPLSSVIEVLVAIALTLPVKSAPPAPAPGTVTKSPTFRSSVNVVLNPVTVLLEPFMETLPLRVKDVSNTKFAVKSAPETGEFINNDLTSSKFLDVIAETVSSLLLASSIILLALLEVVCADEISFSPTLKLPDTVIN